MNNFLVTTNTAFIPLKGSDNATCSDLILSEDVTIAPDAIFLAPTGVKTNFASKLYARSSLAIKKRLMLVNSVGIIDADYRGEIKVALWNFSKDSITLKKGERLAQMESSVKEYDILIDVDKYNDWDKVDSSERGEGGFGSTGGYEKK